VTGRVPLFTVVPLPHQQQEDIDIFFTAFLIDIPAAEKRKATPSIPQRPLPMTDYREDYG